MKPYIKLRPFFPRSSAQKPPADFSQATALPSEYLNEVSVFETLRAEAGRFVYAPEHWRRLSESCAALGRSMPLTPKQIDGLARTALGQSRFENAILRLSVHWLTPSAGMLVLNLRAFDPQLVKARRQQGVLLRTSPVRRSSPRALNAQIKSSQYVSGVLAALEDPGGERSEPVFLDHQLCVAECSVSNIFIIKEKRVLTPPSASGILKGVTRSHAMAAAARRGLEVVETFFTRHELYNADECFLTSTLSDVLPVIAADGRAIGGGRPGRWCAALVREFELKGRFD